MVFFVVKGAKLGFEELALEKNLEGLDFLDEAEDAQHAQQLEERKIGSVFRQKEPELRTEHFLLVEKLRRPMLRD